MSESEEGIKHSARVVGNVRQEVEAMYKVELHAHLFGSILRKNIPDALHLQIDALNSKHLTVEQCFDYFSALYQSVHDPKTYADYTRKVFQEFARQNVLYLEIRSTLKEDKKLQFTFLDYAAIIVTEAKRALKELGMHVRVLLSVDRGKLKTQADAEAALDAILQCYHKHTDYIVGVDICGDPTKNDITNILALLKSNIIDKNAPYHNKLKVTVHTAEIDDEKETDAILNTRCGRIAHCCYLTPAQEKKCIDHNVFIEMCLTSNFNTMQLDCHSVHPRKEFFAEKIKHGKLSICTDDVGLFCTDLNEELCKAVETLGLVTSDLKKIQKDAMHAAFCDDDTKALILSRL